MKQYSLHSSYYKPRKHRWPVLVAVGLVVVSLLAAGWFFEASRQNGPGLPGLSGSRGDSAGQNPLHGKKLYVDPNGNAVRQANEWRAARPADAALMDKLAAQPSSNWVVNEATLTTAATHAAQAAEQGATPVFVLYHIPSRDCGMYSSGGAANADAYRDFVTRLGATIGERDTVVIVEPDALAQVAANPNQETCLNDEQQTERYALLNFAVDTLKALPKTTVYLDGGNSGWIPDAAEVAARLEKAGVKKADGFSLNVSNFRPLDETTDYGEEVSKKLGSARFVVDTSRNGVGAFQNPDRPEFNWCNPPGRALGHHPTVETKHKLIDAYLYIKNAGESDGQDSDPLKCFGGPAAGTWWPDYALGLIQRWPQPLQP